MNQAEKKIILLLAVALAASTTQTGRAALLAYGSAHQPPAPKEPTAEEFQTVYDELKRRRGAASLFQRFSVWSGRQGSARLFFWYASALVVAVGVLAALFTGASW
ncbi:MAG: hypothetical protein ABL856_12545 [Gallionella sp.]